MANKMLTLSAFFIGFILIGLPEIIIASTKDGFNIYKDLLRGKGEEDDVVELVDDPRGSKVSYFYRTPAQIGLRGQTSSDIGKRTINRFKSYMLGKESLSDEELRKRGAGAILGWTLSNKQTYDREGFSSYPGENHQAIFVEN